MIRRCRPAYLGGAAGEAGSAGGGKAAGATAPAAAETEKAFVRPRARPSAAGSADTFAGESISALVARAAGKTKVSPPGKRSGDACPPGYGTDLYPTQQRFVLQNRR